MQITPLTFCFTKECKFKTLPYTGSITKHLKKYHERKIQKEEKKRKIQKEIQLRKEKKVLIEVNEIAKDKETTDSASSNVRMIRWEMMN